MTEPAKTIKCSGCLKEISLGDRTNVRHALCLACCEEVKQSGFWAEIDAICRSVERPASAEKDEGEG